MYRTYEYAKPTSRSRKKQLAAARKQSKKITIHCHLVKTSVRVQLGINSSNKQILGDVSKIVPWL